MVMTVRRLASLPLAPVQGIWLSRTMTRFPDAEGRTGEVGVGERRMKVVVLGDSVTAGYAIAHHERSVAGRLAALVAERFDATVEWAVLAVSGYTAGEAVALAADPALTDADLVFVSIGVNDLKNLHTASRFRRELGALLDAVLASAPQARVCLLGIPPLEHFPAFPSPLADVLGWRGRAFDAIGANAVATRDRAYRIAPTEPLSAEMFGPDGFHPSETLHDAFARAALAGYEPEVES